MMLLNGRLTKKQSRAAKTQNQIIDMKIYDKRRITKSMLNRVCELNTEIEQINKQLESYEK